MTTSPYAPTPELPAPDALARIALEAATDAALLILDRSRSGVAATKSSATDVVTDMDRQAQELLAQTLHAARPEDAFFGEEGGSAAGSRPITWVVDPIDGTVNYVYDIPAYAVSVAAVTGDVHTPGAWRPVAGAVVNPVSGERFWGATGTGAWRQRGRHTAMRVRVSTQADLGLSLIGTGFGYDAEQRARQARALTAILPRVRDIRRFGSAALDLCHVADGTLDGYYEEGLNPWDMAAGWLLVTEAGGRVENRDGGDPEKAMTIAGGACFSHLAELVRTAP